MTDFTSLSQVYPNPPRPIISKGKKNPGIYTSELQSKEWLCLNSPSSSIYEPNYSYLYKSSSVPRLGNEKRKDYFLQSKDRSPGPIYMLPSSPSRTTTFGKGEKTSVKPNNLPAPNSYFPSIRQTKIPVTLKSREPVNYFCRNTEKLLKGKLGPGPGSYNSELKLKDRVFLSKAARIMDCN